MVGDNGNTNGNVLAGAAPMSVNSVSSMNNMTDAGDANGNDAHSNNVMNYTTMGPGYGYYDDDLEGYKDGEEGTGIGTGVRGRDAQYIVGSDESSEFETIVC